MKKSYKHSGFHTARLHHRRAVLCFILVAVMSFGSASPLFAVPEDGPAPAASLPGTGSITTDLAPEVERPFGTGDSEADSEEARELLARATPAQRAELESFYAQLDAIDRETEIAVEEYNAARTRLEAIATNIEISEQDVAILVEAFDLQAQRLGERAVEIYRGSNDVLLGLLFEAESLSDLLERINIANKMVEADTDLMARIRLQRAALENSIQQLSLDESEAASLEFEMRARMIEVTARNEDRKQELRDQNFAMLRLFEAEQLQRMLAEQELAFSIQDGNNRDIVIEPGSPVETAMTLRGVPYLWGGASRRGFDCSGLMRFIFAQHGINLPHHSGSQVLQGSRVVGALQPGDLVFFGTPIHHVGMYVGGGYFIHAPRSGEVVSLRSLASRSDMVAARRLDWQPREGAPR
ncbi:MAG: NlpC/P60 family protein [Coriobacteriia bacterium]|nr:NlpC/P60 family protein [Coriobacteriia bacterium]MCL2537855.1 NlpC/P60 family protein [Coriobacteriia bacterium]